MHSEESLFRVFEIINDEMTKFIRTLLNFVIFGTQSSYVMKYIFIRNSENPHDIVDQQMHSQGVNFCCGF